MFSECGGGKEVKEGEDGGTYTFISHGTRTVDIHIGPGDFYLLTWSAE